MHEFTRLAESGHLLAAFYAYESQIPSVATAKIDGLSGFTGVNDERELAFFALHQKADVWHARTGANLIGRHCGTEDDRKRAIDGADRALGALWSLADAC
jgi:pyrroloquinoline-quinone synthase